MAELQLLEVGFPFRLDGSGRVASPPYQEHVEQLIEQLLFTAPGERVNRPEFGCGLLETVFASISQEELTAVQFLVQSALHRWLGQVIQTESVTVAGTLEDEMTVTIRYRLLRDGLQRVSTFRRRGP